MAQPVDVSDEFGLRYLVVHGHQRAYRMAGAGPALLLLHGLGRDSSTWLPVLPYLSRRFTVIAPDLLGHGASAKPRGDYSLGGYANGMRDLLTLLGIDKATVVGHSFGGGIAMQYAYQFPERTERLALIAPGGMGPEVSAFIRALTLPGVSVMLSVAGLRPFRPVVAGTLTTLSRSRLPHTRDLAEVAEIYRRMLCDPKGRFAVRHVTSAVLDWRGQIVTMTDRAYLTRLMPMCVVWGQADAVIPVSHAYSAQAYAPGAEVHVVPRAGHFPHKEQPEQVARILIDFVDGHAAATYHRGRWRRLMQGGDPADPKDVPSDSRDRTGPGRRGTRSSVAGSAPA